MLFLVEISSVCFTLFYLYFAARKNALAWIFGTLASILSAYFLYHKGFYGSMILNMVYTVQGVLGFINWKIYLTGVEPAYKWQLRYHLLTLAACLAVSFFLYRLFMNLGFVEFIYADILLALGSLVATTLEIRKDTSCWWYWIVCNFGYTYLYLSQSVSGGQKMYLYALLMLVLAVFSVFALKAWTAKAKVVG